MKNYGNNSLAAVLAEVQAVEAWFGTQGAAHDVAPAACREWPHHCANFANCDLSE